MGRAETTIRDWCVDYLAKMLERPPGDIDPNATFTRLGLDSASATYFVVALEEWLGVELDPEVVFEHVTIDALARHLAAPRDAAAG